MTPLLAFLALVLLTVGLPMLGTWWALRVSRQRVQARIEAGEHPIMARAAEDAPRLFAEARKRERLREEWRATRCRVVEAGTEKVCVLTRNHDGDHLFGTIL